MNTDSYHTLLEKLDEFIRKYYKNQLIRGLLYFSSTTLIFYLLITSIEYFAHFDTLPRTILFYSFIGVILLITYKWIVTPLLKYNKLGATLSNEQAASIIGDHFAEVQDKLLNILQLNQQKKTTNSLIEASINQKIKELKLVPFSKAIDLSKNKRYVKYTAVPMLVLLVLLFAAPSMITNSTKRLIKHRTYFEEEAPFQFIIQNGSLTAFQHEDFELKIKLSGNEIPNEVYLEANGSEYKLEKENTIAFHYAFKNIQKTTTFRLSADGFRSKEYELVALPKPTLLDFQIQLNYPAYLGKQSELLKNTGDLFIPEGTQVAWRFNTENTKVLSMQFPDTSIFLKSNNGSMFELKKKFLSNTTYAVSTANDYLKNKDSVVYAIRVNPDLYPTIQVEEQKDSLSYKQIYFNGSTKDDYGFSRLLFHYKQTRLNEATEKKEIKKEESIPIAINLKSNNNTFFHFYDLNTMAIEPGDEIGYYFEIWDNDGVHGAKSTRSQTMIYKAPTQKEMEELKEKNNSDLKKDLEQSISQAKDIQKQISDLNKNILEKKTLSWEEKKKLQNLLEKEKKLEKNVDEIQKQNDKNNIQQNELSKTDESIAEKQKQLEQLFENIMTDEMKQMYKELEKLMDKLDKEKVQEMLDKMKFSNKDIEKELDRTLELFKQLEVEQKLTESIEKLNKLAEKQEKLRNKTEEKNADNKQLQEKQNELNKEFEEIKKDLSELEKKNEELENPNDIKKTDAQQKEIEEQMKQSSEQLQQNKNKKASESQQNASDKMEELAQQMQQMQEAMQEQNQTEDINALRDILENLITLSFDQEAVMNEIGKTKTNNPQYVQLTQRQKKLQDDVKLIEDSLLALSKRAPQIESVVNREINAINMNMEKAIDALAERQTTEGTSRQQFAMTSINNLALMLSEALEQMQAEMRQKSQSPGNGSCNKPGGKGQKPSMSNMRQMQEKLNQQMQQLKQEMEGGKKDGKKGSGKSGNGGMSQELAKLAAQQAALRQELQKMMENMKKDGKTPGSNVGNLAEKMEETETDLVNKNITQETIKRQQEILTRLLEHEKAEQEREQDEKRQSNESKNEKYSNLNQFLEYKRQKQKEMELLKTVPPSLNEFYKNKVSEYFNNFENTK